MATAVSHGTAVRISCLGPGAVSLQDGSRAGLRTRKHLALLLLLANARSRSVSRDQLVELLWSEDGDRQARHSLSQAISLINKTVGRELIVPAAHGHLALADGMWELDVGEFERYAAEGRHAEARALWRGTLLEGTWIRRAPNFERWLTDERDRLERTLRRIVHQLIEQRRTEGDYAAMRLEAETLLELDPLDEGAMLACLEALSLGGDRTLALRRYAEFETRLSRELNAQPGTRLKSWARRQRKGDEEPPLPPMLLRVHETPSLPAVQPFFGRVEEFRQLWESWERAQAGTGCFWIIEGEAGIGKTAIAGKLANQAHVAGASVCYVKCYRTEKSVPFAPISALIRQLSRLPGFLAMNPTWIGELTRLVPELRERFPHVPQPMAVDDSARFRLCDATVHAAECVADEQPLMIVVDDIHDADEATLALLHFLGRQVARWPAALVTTTRPITRVYEPLHTFRQTTTSLGLARLLSLSALHDDELSRVVQSVSANRGAVLDEPSAQRIVANARGNPLIATEWVIDALRKPLGGSGHSSHLSILDDTAWSRFSQLPANVKLALSSILLTGRPTSEFEVSRLTGLTAAAVANAVIALENAGLVRRGDSGLVISHERYIDALTARIRPDQRKQLHKAMARSLAAFAPENPAVHQELAKHCEAAGMIDEAILHARAAAEHAASVGAKASQKEALETVMRLGGASHDSELMQLAECYEELGDFGSLSRLVSEAEARGVASPQSISALRCLKALGAWRSGALTAEEALAAVTLVLQAQESFPYRQRGEFLLMRLADKVRQYRAVKEAAKRLRLTALRTRGSMDAGAHFATAYVISKYYSPRRALWHVQQALQLAEDSNDWWLEKTLRDTLGVVLKMLGRYRASIEQFEFALGLARRTMDPMAEVAALHNRAVSELSLGEFDRVRETHAESALLATQFPDWTYSVYRHYNDAMLALYTQEPDSAARLFESSIERAQRARVPSMAASSCAGMALAQFRAGRVSEMARSVEYLRTLEPVPDWLTCDWIKQAATSYHQAVVLGKPETALREARRVSRVLRRRDVSHWLALELEIVFLQEHLAGGRLPQLREELIATAVGYEANGIAAALS